VTTPPDSIHQDSNPTNVFTQPGSLRDVAAELEAHGHLSAARTRYSAKAVARMVAT
jgi:hypothetical protein